MKIGNTIFLFFKTPEPAQIKQVKTMTEIRDELKTLFPKCPIFLADSKYTITTNAEIERLLKFNMYKDRSWVWDDYDCDNYSFSLKGLMGDLAGNICLGIAWVNRTKDKHAVNIFRNEKGEYYYIEPQTNEVFHIGGAKAITEAYDPYLIVI